MIISLLLSRTSYCNPSHHLKNQLLIHRRDRFDLYFAGRPVAKLPCRVYGYVINNVLTPFLAHVDHSEVARSREKSVPTPTFSIPVSCIRDATLARIQPTNIDQDPYFASILIALAKAWQHACPYNITACPSAYTVRLYLNL